MTTPAAASVRVKSIHAKGLFGMYDHDVILNEQHMTVVHGSNGVGKTVLFKLVRDLLAGTGVELLRYPFNELCVKFSNKAVVTATSDDKHRTVKIVSYDNKSININQESFNKLAHRLERRLPIHQMGPNLWIDPETDEKLSAYEVVSRYGNRGDDGIDGQFEGNLDKWRKSQEFFPKVHVIEAQRLIKLKTISFRHFRDSEEHSIRDTVIEYSQQLKNKINDKLTEYGKQAQKLDQTFPQRLFEGVNQSADFSQIKEDLKNIENQQENYRKLGLVEEKLSPVQGLEQLDNDPVKFIAITVYVADMKAKLCVLESLAQRIFLLLAQINDKFTNKNIFINKKHELAIKTSHGDEIPVSALSSGEQHQIVLAYDMLFRIEPNSLVMIDEPELSLHVNWQERFLSDLENVIKIANFDALIATHSPYVINGRNELVVSLSTEDKYQQG